MAITWRQVRAYSDRVNLYAPVAADLGPNNEAGDDSVSLAFSDVACHWEARPESSIPAAPGRTNQDYLTTTDAFHFAADQEIADGWFIELSTAGHPEQGAWFVVVGAPSTHMWRAGKLTVFARKSLSPL